MLVIIFDTQIFVKDKVRSVEYIHRKSDTLFIPGVFKKTFFQKSFQGKVRIRKKDPTVINDSASSAINSLSVAVHELNADSIEVNFDFGYFNEIITRIDTIKISRVDTLRITNIIEKGIPFYRSFWFGASVAAIEVMIVFQVAGAYNL